MSRMIRVVRNWLQRLLLIMGYVPIGQLYAVERYCSDQKTVLNSVLGRIGDILGLERPRVVYFQQSLFRVAQYWAEVSPDVCPVYLTVTQPFDCTHLLNSLRECIEIGGQWAAAQSAFQVATPISYESLAQYFSKRTEGNARKLMLFIEWKDTVECQFSDRFTDFLLQGIQQKWFTVVIFVSPGKQLSDKLMRGASIFR